VAAKKNELGELPGVIGSIPTIATGKSTAGVQGFLNKIPCS